jgi:glyoxylase-like metal-dependent hydrolase (beta-lactamase superfamily II)
MEGAFQGVRDDEVLELGNTIIRVIHTPGHTPEHVSLLVSDRSRSDEPWMVLTGHTLLVGDMGRTELASSAADGAAALFESAERLRALPDYLQVFPGAYSGSVCGRGLSGNPSSTIGFERRHNQAFGVTDREEFIRQMLSDIPPKPPEADEIRARNLSAPGPGL